MTTIPGIGRIQSTPRTSDPISARPLRSLIHDIALMWDRPSCAESVRRIIAEVERRGALDDLPRIPASRVARFKERNP
jgi:hypothetical protein